jgi:PAS domain S-box-containing protein
MMAIVIAIAALVIFSTTLAGIFVFRDTLPIYILLILIILAWWAARRKGWLWLAHIPSLLCLSLGIYGSFISGFDTILVLFYVLAVVLTELLQPGWANLLIILTSIVSYLGLGFWVDGLTSYSLSDVITFLFVLIGVALLQWYTNGHLKIAFEAQVEVNKELRLEIARRQLAETVQREQETQIRRLADNVTDLVAEIDTTGIVKYASPSYRSVLGYTPDTLIGTNGYDLVHPDDLPPTLDTARYIAARHVSGSVQIRVRHSDGRYLIMEFSANPIFDERGEHNGFVLAGHDITVQKLTEDKFSTAFQTSPDSININRLADGVYLDINQGFTRLTGYSQEDVLGKSSLALNVWVDPNDRARLAKGLREHGVVENLEARFRRKNGEIGTGLMSARVITIQEEKCILSITRDITDRIRAELELRDVHAKLEQSYEATLQGWADILDLRERETADHSRRVVDSTLKVARALGIEGEELIHIRRGALLHDIGKMRVPDEILLKPAPLTEDEWAIMRLHPEYARMMLGQIDYLIPSIVIPYGHHEKWDGSGYPDGLEGEDIPLPARMFAVIDVYDALTHDRPYRSAWSEADALHYLKVQSGIHFDPQIVEIFLEIIKSI